MIEPINSNFAIESNVGFNKIVLLMNSVSNIDALVYNTINRAIAFLPRRDAFIYIMLYTYCKHKRYAIEDFSDYEEFASDDIVRGFLTELKRYDQDRHIFSHLDNTLCKSDFLNNYTAFVESLIQLYVSSSGIRGEWAMPKELALLCTSISKSMNIKDVYNPYAGLCSFEIYGNYENYHGEELDELILTIAKYRLDAHNCNTGDICLEDSRSHAWLGSKAIMSMPPFGMQINKDKYRWMSNFGYEVKNDSEFVIAEFLSMPGWNKGIVIVPHSFCFQQGCTQRIRKELTESHIVSAVIELPQQILNGTSIVCSVLVLDKDNKSDLSIIDASECFQQVEKWRRILDYERILNLYENKSSNVLSPSIEECRNKDYSFIYNKYKDTTIGIPEGFEVVPLKDILTLIPSNRNHQDKTGRIVSISDLSDKPFQNEIVIEKLSEGNVSNLTKITERCLLISTIRSVKPTICNASIESPVYLKPNVQAWHVSRDGICLEYLREEILERTSNLAVGIAIPHITKRSFLSSVVGLSSYEEQRSLFSERKKAYQILMAKEQGLMDIIESIKAEYINEVRCRKHDMRPYLREISSAVRLLRKYIDKGETYRLLGVLDKQEVAIKALSNLVEILSEEDAFGTPEDFNIDEYFCRLCIQNTHSEYFDIEYTSDSASIQEAGIITDAIEERIIDSSLNHTVSRQEEIEIYPLYTSINHVDFERLVNNILENAIKHGFLSQRNIKGNKVEIRVSVVNANDHKMFQIDISNNGTPFPEGLTKERYGLLGEKAGLTGGDGKGGNIVNRIVKHFGGDYDIVTLNGNPTVRVYLPLKSN